MVVVGEGDAWRREAVGAPSKVDSLVGSCTWSTPSSAMLSPGSFPLPLFLFTGLVSTSSTGRALKAIAVHPANRQPRPLAHVRAPKVQRQVQVRALQALALLVPQAPSSRRCPPSLCPYSPLLLRTVLSALGVRHRFAAGTQRLCASATRRFYSVFSGLFSMYFSCCLLLVMGSCCLFLILKVFW